MKKVESFKFTYRPVDDSGKIFLILEGEGTGTVEIDSPAEAQFMLNLLRTEDEIYFDEANELIVIGIQPVGEDADD